MRARPFLALLLAASGLAPARGLQDEPRVLWRDVRARGERGTDLVFLPDGFREEERAAFEQSVRAALAGLEAHSASFVAAEREAWNVHVAFVPSAEACPARSGPRARSRRASTA